MMKPAAKHAIAATKTWKASLGLARFTRWRREGREGTYPVAASNPEMAKKPAPNMKHKVDKTRFLIALRCVLFE
jgi:hypothetical protein